MRFRVFDKQEKKYVESDSVVIKQDGQLYSVRFCGVIEFYILDPDRYVVEFSTGKEDFTGKTIYDGDTAIDSDDDEVTIEYDKEDAVFHIVYSTFVETFSVIDSKDLKIIGTINGDENGKD